MAVDHKLKSAVDLQAESPSENDGLLPHDPDKITLIVSYARIPGKKSEIKGSHSGARVELVDNVDTDQCQRRGDLQTSWWI